MWAYGCLPRDIWLFMACPGLMRLMKLLHNALPWHGQQSFVSAERTEVPAFGPAEGAGTLLTSGVGADQVFAVRRNYGNDLATCLVLPRQQNAEGLRIHQLLHL